LLSEIQATYDSLPEIKEEIYFADALNVIYSQVAAALKICKQ